MLHRHNIPISSVSSSFAELKAALAEERSKIDEEKRFSDIEDFSQFMTRSDDFPAHLLHKDFPLDSTHSSLNKSLTKAKGTPISPEVRVIPFSLNSESSDDDEIGSKTQKEKSEKSKTVEVDSSDQTVLVEPPSTHQSSPSLSVSPPQSFPPSSVSSPSSLVSSSISSPSSLSPDSHLSPTSHLSPSSIRSPQSHSSPHRTTSLDDRVVLIDCTAEVMRQEKGPGGESFGTPREEAVWSVWD